MNKTEELVQKCFCTLCIISCENPSCSLHATDKLITDLARAARRFVRMEQAEKIKKHNEFMKKFYRNRAKLRNENIVKLPKHFGQFKVNGKWI